MVAGHIGRDAVGMERQAGGAMITVNHAGQQAAGAVGVTSVEGRGHFETGCLIIDILARVVIDGKTLRPGIRLGAYRTR